MYCFHLDGIRKTPGKPGDLWLRVSGGKVIPPYSTCPIAWPFLENHEFDYCKSEGMAMLVEPTDQDDGLPALVGGVHNLRQGQQAKACLTMLLRNSDPTSLVVRDLEIVGKAMLIRTGKVDKEWKRKVDRHRSHPARRRRSCPQQRQCQEEGEA